MPTQLETAMHTDLTEAMEDLGRTREIISGLLNHLGRKRDGSIVISNHAAFVAVVDRAIEYLDETRT